MQRGLRVVGGERMWVEYFRLELMYLEKIKQRLVLFGIHETALVAISPAFSSTCNNSKPKKKSCGTHR